jgi:hypothetical protein
VARRTEPETPGTGLSARRLYPRGRRLLEPPQRTQLRVFRDGARRIRTADLRGAILVAGSFELVIVRASMIQAPLASRFRAVHATKRGSCHAWPRRSCFVWSCERIVSVDLPRCCKRQRGPGRLTEFKGEGPFITMMSGARRGAPSPRTTACRPGRWEPRPRADCWHRSGAAVACRATALLVRTCSSRCVSALDGDIRSRSTRRCVRGFAGRRV